MLNEEQIEQNKKSFIDLINSIGRDFDKNKLIAWLENSDFFTAPASIKNNSNFPGGLCLHSLNVFAALENICNNFCCNNSGECLYDSDSIKIVALLHDINKANYFEPFKRNVKDADGKWIQVDDYRIKDAENRFIFGNREETSLYMVKSFIPNLTVEEEVAILTHLGGKGYDSTQMNLGEVYNKYNLACALHVADMLSTFVLKC